MAQRLAVLLALASIAILVCAEEAKQAATPAAAASAVDVQKSDHKGYHDKKDSYDKKDKYDDKKEKKYEHKDYDKKDKYEKKYEHKDYDTYSKGYDKYDKYSGEYSKYGGDYDKYGDYKYGGYKGDYDKYHSYGGYKGDYDKYHSYGGYKSGYKGDYDKYHSYGGYEGYAPEGYNYGSGYGSGYGYGDGGLPHALRWELAATPTGGGGKIGDVLKQIKAAKKASPPPSKHGRGGSSSTDKRDFSIEWDLKCSAGDELETVINIFLGFDTSFNYGKANFYGQTVDIDAKVVYYEWWVLDANCTDELIPATTFITFDDVNFFQAVIRQRVDPESLAGRKLMGASYGGYSGYGGEYSGYGYGGDYNYGEYGPGPTTCALASILSGYVTVGISKDGQQAVYDGILTAVVDTTIIDLETATQDVKDLCASRGVPVLKDDTWLFKLQKFELGKY